MIERIIYRAAAENELREAYQWYEERERGLGMEFIRAMEVCTLTIRCHPEIYPSVHKNIRQGLVRRFPYSILYIDAGTKLIAIAVFHSSRDPKIWKRRV